MSWFSHLFGGGNKNPADSAMPYLNQIPGQTQQYQQPFFEAGKNAIQPLQEQYGQLLNDPGAKMNKMGESFQQSPGFQFAMQQALEAANHASAAGGMAGTPQSQYEQMQLATQLGNQDYNKWMENTLGLYGKGLSGEEGMATRGQQAGQSMADMIAQVLAQQANVAFQGQSQKNENNNGLWGGLRQMGGAALGGFTGGPMGAFAGWNAMK